MLARLPTTQFVTAGQQTWANIQGDGEAVNWDLSGAAPGRYHAYVDIDTGSGDEACQAFASTTVVVKRCPPPQPVCPSVSIICPENPELGQILTFSSDVTGGTPGVTGCLQLDRLSGTNRRRPGNTDRFASTPQGFRRPNCYASLSMGGYTLDCSATCSVSFPVPCGMPEV